MSNALVTFNKPVFGSPTKWDLLYAKDPEGATEEVLTDFVLEVWNNTFHLPEPMKRYEGMHNPMAGIFHGVRQLSRLLSSNPAVLCTADQQRYILSAWIIEMQTNCSSYSEGAIRVRMESNQNLHITYWAWNISIAIYNYLVFRSMPRSSSVFDILVTRLKSNLDSIDPEQLWSSFPLPLLLWILVIGGWAATDRPEYPFFLTQVSRLRRSLGLEIWEQAKLILLEYAWVEHICELPCKSFWLESDLI